MNKGQRQVNNGIKTIARREWEAKQARIAREQAERVRKANAAFAATLAKGN